MSVLLGVFLVLGVAFGIGEYQTVADENQQLNAKVASQAQEIEQLTIVHKAPEPIETIDGIAIQNLSGPSS